MYICIHMYDIVCTEQRLTKCPGQNVYTCSCHTKDHCMHRSLGATHKHAHVVFVIYNVIYIVTVSTYMPYMHYY